MKVFSVMQPFASLIALRAKFTETRKRDFTGGFQGTVAIHASKGTDYLDLCDEEPFRTALAPLRQPALMLDGGIASGIVLPFGAIIAVGDLEATLPIRNKWEVEEILREFIYYRTHATGDELTRLAERELAFDDYTPGRYMLLLKNVVALDKPIPARGQLGLWNFDMRDPRGKAI